MFLFNILCILALGSILRVPRMLVMHVMRRIGGRTLSTCGAIGPLLLHGQLLLFHITFVQVFHIEACDGGHDVDHLLLYPPVRMVYKP